MLARSPRRAAASRGATVLEVMVVIAVIVLGLVLLPVALPARRTGCGRYMKDSTQVRAMVQAMVVFADSNKGSYPLPSMLDASDATVAETGEAKNSTGNILSVLVFNGFISPEICISAAEVNGRIQRHDTYEYSTPGGAVRPVDALWDPSFRGTPDDPVTYGNISSGGVAHQSYAHVLPFGNRRKQWSDTYNSTEAVFGNRGPTYAQDDRAPAAKKWSLTADELGTGSNTLLIHGGRRTWEGNVGYNDNHVNFETTPMPEALTLVIPGKPKSGVNTLMPDNLFVNETDQIDGDGATDGVEAGRNAYLRPITSVAASPTVVKPRVWRD